MSVPGSHARLARSQPKVHHVQPADRDCAPAVSLCVALGHTQHSFHLVDTGCGPSWATTVQAAPTPRPRRVPYQFSAIPIFDMWTSARGGMAIDWATADTVAALHALWLLRSAGLCTKSARVMRGRACVRPGSRGRPGAARGRLGAFSDVGGAGDREKGRACIQRRWRTSARTSAKVGAVLAYQAA